MADLDLSLSHPPTLFPHFFVFVGHRYALNSTAVLIQVPVQPMHFTQIYASTDDGNSSQFPPQFLLPSSRSVNPFGNWKTEADSTVIFIVNERRLHNAMLLLVGSTGGIIELTPRLR